MQTALLPLQVQSNTIGNELRRLFLLGGFRLLIQPQTVDGFSIQVMGQTSYGLRLHGILDMLW